MAEKLNSLCLGELCKVRSGGSGKRGSAREQAPCSSSIAGPGVRGWK